MHKTNSVLVDIEKRMSQSGLGGAYVQTSMQELREHWEDVKLESEREGCSEQQAEEIATARMGDPVKLTKMFKERKQQASWVGRHPVIVFGIFPLLAIVGWWIAFLSVQVMTSGVLEWDQNKSMPEPSWEWMRMSMKIISISSGVILPVIFCRLSRLHVSSSGALLGCLCIGIHNLFHSAKLTTPDLHGKGSFTWGYHVSHSLLHLNLTGFALPLLVFLFFVLSNRRRSRVLIQN